MANQKLAIDNSQHEGKTFGENNMLATLGLLKEKTRRQVVILIQGLQWKRL
jgi:hypothetical protein